MSSYGPRFLLSVVALERVAGVPLALGSLPPPAVPARALAGPPRTQRAGAGRCSASADCRGGRRPLLVLGFAVIEAAYLFFVSAGRLTTGRPT